MILSKFWGVRFFYFFVRPKNQDEDIQIKEFVYNTLLFWSIAFLSVASILSLFYTYFFKHVHDNGQGLPPIVILTILAIFLIFYFFSRQGYLKLSIYFFILVYYSITTFTIYSWGIDLPAALLLYALTIVMSGILISANFGLFVTTVIAATIALIGNLQISSTIEFKSYWRAEIFDRSDILVYTIILTIILVVTWLSNRQIERALKRARHSEAELIKERDSLEIKVEERTQELKKVQLEKMTQLYRFAEFGRLSSGIFHDLINPMTAISLNLERLKDLGPKEINNTQSYLNSAFEATKRMEDFIMAIRKQIQKENTAKIFSLTEEIIQTLQILNHRAQQSGVEILFSPITDNIETFGDPVRFTQVIMNLVCNAIDSYDQTSGTSRQVEIGLAQTANSISLTVRDHGCGIPAVDQSKIFNPFYTTKRGTDKGLGIGLSSAKNIIEKDFAGTIELSSQENSGTTFTVTLPKLSNCQTKA